MEKKKLINPNNNLELYFEKELLKDKDGNKFLVLNDIPRFTSKNNYAESFGFQWRKFKKTQLSNEKLKKNYRNEVNSLRLFAETNWDMNKLSNLNILEAGSGAGRFTNSLLEETQANVYSLDYSEAVDINKENNLKYFQKRLFLVQSDICKIPYEDNTFDKVLCIGVLQHTEDFYKSIDSLISKLKTNGEIVIDFYPINGFWTKINAKYILRPILSRLNKKTLLNLIKKNISKLIWMHNFLSKYNLGILNRFIPICDIKNTLPKNLSPEEIKEWAILDTFDMFSPKYDNPQKISDVKLYLEKKGVLVTFADFVFFHNMKAAVIRGIKQ